MYHYHRPSSRGLHALPAVEVGVEGDGADLDVCWFSNLVAGDGIWGFRVVLDGRGDRLPSACAHFGACPYSVATKFSEEAPPVQSSSGRDAPVKVIVADTPRVFIH